MKNKFKFLSGDINWVDYGGIFYRNFHNDNKKFFMMEVVNCENLNININSKYIVELSVVDLNLIDKETINKALECCGFQRYRKSFLSIAEACYSYGNKAPIKSYYGNNFKKLMKSARELSYTLEQYKDDYRKKMDRPVNKIGTSAEEYMKGNIL